ncbi:MAG: response regulator [Bacteroidota bacterium]
MSGKPHPARVIRALLVDDEELARQLLREHLVGRTDVELLAECSNGFEAVKAITELKPDLIFLDIQMPKLDGFEVLELLEEVPAIIFVTAYDQYALKAFEVHAVDYLLKPFTRERFEEAFVRAKERISKNVKLPVADLVDTARPEKRGLERILIREGSNVIVIPADKIDYIEAQDDYVSLRSEGKNHLKHQRLADLEHSLEPSRFVRIHRSFILNLERLARLEPYAKDSRVAILKDGTQLPVSKAGYERLKELL